MKISIAITNHNQEKTVDFCIKQLQNQSIIPYEIFVLSDGKKYYNKDATCINNKIKKGRCDNRNSVIEEFLATDSDALIFLDGDTYPKDTTFLEKYNKLLNKYDLIFGTREHTSINGLKLPASDLLTANMDELWLGKDLNYTDLRIVSGAVDAFQNAKTFDEKLDLMITGMIGWSCNFALTRDGIIKLTEFMQEKYNIKNCIFDSTTFSKNWGYEDVAMGIDALFAGLNIWIDEKVTVIHQSHNRSDGLFDHIKGRHLIMNRYRNLINTNNIKNKTYMSIILLYGFFMVGVITGLITGYCAFI